jgi:prolyl-tRNA synthetase
VEKEDVVLARRDNGEKKTLSKNAFLSTAAALLDTIQQEMFLNRRKFREQNTFDIGSYDELKDVVEKGGFARAYWDGSGEDEKQIQEETKASIRCIPFEQDGSEGKCFYTGRMTKQQVVLAKAY